MITAAELTNRAETLAATVATHKAAIRQHRQSLQRVAEELRQVEAECRRRGIGFRQTGASDDGSHRTHRSAG